MLKGEARIFLERENRTDFAGGLRGLGLGTGGINLEGEGKILTEMTGVGRHFRGKVKIQCNGNSLKSTRVNLEKT